MAIQAIIFAIGVWLFQQMAFIPSGLWLLAFIPAIFILKGFSRFDLAWRQAIRWHRQIAWAKHIFAYLLVMALGFAWAGLLASWRLADALPAEWELKEIEVLGVVASLPQALENGTRFTLDVEQVLTPNAKVPQHIAVAQYADGYFKTANTSHLLKFHAGERWHLVLKLKRPHATINPHGVDFEAWALAHNIRAFGTVRNTRLNQRITRFVWRPAYIVQAGRERIQSRMNKVLAGLPYSGVLQALVIGDDTAISQQDWQLFLRTGINHLMSISGLHITMLSSMAFVFVMALWRRSTYLTLRLPARKAAVLAGVVIALTYALLAGFSVPTQRTVYMLMVFALALWSNRPIVIGRVLAYALLVVLVLDPWAVLAPGFYLSFGAVAIIAYGLAGRLGRSNWLVTAARTQWVVTLGLVPCLLLMFQQISLVSPLANAFAIPVESLLVVPFSLLGALLPIDSALLLAHTLMTYLMQALQYLAALPISTWQQQVPPLWSFILAMFGLLWMLLPSGFPLRYLGLVFCLPMFLVMPKSPALGSMQVTVFDVGQGLAVLIRTHQHTLLYDTGPQYSLQSDAGSRVLVPYLRAEGLAHLDGLLVSHNDNDHSGGMRSVLSQVDVAWLVSSLPKLPAEIKSVPHMPCFAGQHWLWDGVRFEMLSPNINTYAEPSIKDNNRSCVLRVASREGSVLLAADIERPVELALTEASLSQLKSDVLIVPHHGSRTSSSETFIDAVSPQMAMVTVGYRNRFGHPKADILERYQRRGIKVYRSDEDGAVLLDFNAQTRLSALSWRKQYRRYWYDQ
ncbi:MAG: DNA internalization-related competence protein ComEC/Rec2 [Candidatus Methylopumilus sp.]